MFNDCINPDSIVMGAPGSSLSFEMYDSYRNPITDPNIYDPNDFAWYFRDPNTNTHLIIEPKDFNYELYPNTWYSFKFDMYGESYDINPCVTGNIDWSDNYVLYFIPSEDLSEGTVYFLTINTNARDQNGVSMPETFTLKFRTASASLHEA